MLLKRDYGLVNLLGTSQQSIDLIFTMLHLIIHSSIIQRDSKYLWLFFDFFFINLMLTG